MNAYTVYKHTGPTGKVYIGITRKRPEQRWDNGKGYKHSPHFWAAIHKYGWPAFEHEILATGLTKEDAERMEVELIAKHRSTDRRFGYNADLGGSATGHMSAETRRKLAAHMLGDLNPTRRLGHPFAGKHHSAASRAKMSAAAKARTGRIVTAETRQKLRVAEVNRPVVCTTTGAEYRGIHEAEEATGLTATKICAVCKGRRKTTGGLRWSYKDEGQAAAIEALRLEVVNGVSS